MTDYEKKIIKESIIRQIAELEEDLKLLEEAAKPIPPDSAYGRISRMEAINSKAITDSVLQDKRITLSRFKFFLSKIDSAEYGKCAKCGKDIAVRRLISLPYANLCIACASKYGQ